MKWLLNAFTHKKTITFYENGKWCWRPETKYVGFSINGLDILVIVLLITLLFN